LSSYQSELIAINKRGIILFKDGDTNEPIGIEVLSYHPGDDRINGISLELGQQNFVKT